MSAELPSQAGAARIDPMRQPEYHPRPHVPPRDLQAAAPAPAQGFLHRLVMEIAERGPGTVRELANRLSETVHRISPFLSEAKSRGLLVAVGPMPATWKVAPPGTPFPAPARHRKANTGLRAQLRQILATEGALTVPELLVRFPEMTRAKLIDNIRKWEAEGGCRRIDTLEPSIGPLVCLPDQEIPCPSPPAPVAIASTSSPTPTPQTSPAGSPSPEAHAVAVPAAPPVSAPMPTEAPTISSPTPTPAPEPRSATAADLPSLEDARRDPVLLGTLEAYWGLQQALDQYVDSLLAQDPIYVALASALDAAEAAVRRVRRSP